MVTIKQRQTPILFTILFLISFDFHAQMPFLSPYMLSLGASSMMIGVLLGAVSFSKLTGNLVAGPFLDRYSKRMFIGVGLLLVGVILFGHAYIQVPQMLLVLRMCLGFVMSFVSPACFALLSELGKTGEEQGRLMAKNGMITTIASIIAPTAGGLLVTKLGYHSAFLLLGGLMMLSGLIALVGLSRKEQTQPARLEVEKQTHTEAPEHSLRVVLSSSSLYPAYLFGFAMMYANGTIMYEIPLLIQQQGYTAAYSGTLFSIMAIGELLVLSQLWLNRTSPLLRCFVSLFVTGLLMYAMAIDLALSLFGLMFLLGAFLGVLFPAMTMILTVNISQQAYGRAFSLFSAMMSCGAIISPMVSGLYKNWHHSFFIAFLVVLGSLVISLLLFESDSKSSRPVWR